ncbi:MAG: EAL domain-containing protein [Burkholderiales bacterium]|nr:EAL domain-containing protein [Burkholderiales bacterium]
MLAAGVTRWLLKRQLTPLWSAIESLEAAAQSPHPPHALPIAQRDEIGKLLGAFNRLLATLAQREQLLQQVLDTSSVAIFVVDQEGRIIQANRRMGEMFGCTVEQLVGSEYVNLIHPGERENGRQRMRALMASTRTEVDLDRQYWRADQSRFWGHLSGQRMADAHGELLGLVGVIADITPRVLAEQFEQFRSHVLELMARSEPLAAILQALVQGVETLNPAMLCSVALLDERNALWVACAPSLPADFNQLLDGKTVGPGIGSCGTAAATGQRVVVDDVQAHPDWAPFREPAAQAGLRACWSQPIVAASGRVLGTFSIYHREVHTPSPADIATIEQAARLASIAIEKSQAQERLQLAANVFNHAREGIVITAADGGIIDINQAFTRITGYARDEVLGKNPRILNSGRQGDDYYAAMWRELQENGHWFGELWNRRKNGEVYAELQTISAVRDANGAPLQYVALFSDITTLKEHQQQLEHIAHFDALTGLPNRVLLADRMHLAMAQALRRGQMLAVVFLDLDAFKAINDAHGHEAGDQLLVMLAGRMRHTLRDGDTLAHIGGDEFVAVLTDLSDAAASQPLLDRLLDATAIPTPVAGSLLRLTASVGVTFYPQAEDIDADTLLRQADQAMYQAKLGGKNRCHVFDAERDRTVRGHHESLENIRRALRKREFVLYYQPKVNMRTGQVVGAEALIRWQHPEQGLLPPAAFLPVIEDHALAVEVGEWVIDTALAQMQTWQDAGLTVDVSVNVGARQLQQDDFVACLQMLLARHAQVHPARLELEVLETSALENITGVSAVIAACAALGVRFALDDFGTGYSSLTYLKRLPASLLKIDQSFVRDMLDDPDDLAILEGVIGLADAFRRDVIAEGVETIGHGEMLLQLGCNLAQGYGIARPMPAQALADWVRQWQPDSSWKDVPLVSRDDVPLLFASVELRAWLKAVESHLRGQRERPPPLDPRQCHFGSWLHGPAAKHPDTQAAFAEMDAVHDEIHRLAHTLCELQASGQADQALAGLPGLQALGRDLLAQVRRLSPVRI